MSGRRVDIHDLAAIFGVVPRTVARWQQEGLPVAQKGTSRKSPNLYDTATVIEWVIQRRIGELSVGSDGTVYDYDAERARLTHHQADEKELAVKQLRGELLPAQVVKDLCVAMYAGVKAKMLAITAKVKGRNPGIDQVVLDDVDAEIREALRDVADDGLPVALGSRLAGDSGGDEAAGEVEP